MAEGHGNVTVEAGVGATHTPPDRRQVWAVFALTIGRKLAYEELHHVKGGGRLACHLETAHVHGSVQQAGQQQQGSSGRAAEEMCSSKSTAS